MHLLPCPSCQASLDVSPSQAGDQTNCPVCQATVDIPRLGELRQLPLAASGSVDSPPLPPEDEISAVRRAGFVALGLIATASLLAAAFCGIRWSLIEVDWKTEEHIASYQQEYEQLTPAELVREYEDMEKFGLDLAGPYKYKLAELKKNAWGRNASIAGGIGAISILGAYVLASTGRRNRRGHKGHLGPSPDTRPA